MTVLKPTALTILFTLMIGFTNQVSIKSEPDIKVIRANGIPNHSTGVFPNQNNPNKIKPQFYHLKITNTPKESEKITPIEKLPFGIALNGVLFDPNTAEYWNDDPSSGWNYNAFASTIQLGLDNHNAHVQPNGAYHYHGIPTGLSNTITSKNYVTHIGYAADGFPIYNQYGYSNTMNPNSEIKQLSSSYFVKSGERNSGPGGEYNGDFIEDYEYIPNSGDLDQCNGRYGVTPEYTNGTYYYVITDTFPYIPRCFKGTPDPSFKLIKKNRPHHRRHHRKQPSRHW